MDEKQLRDLINDIKTTMEEIRAQIYTLQRRKKELVSSLLILFDDFYFFVINNVKDDELKEKIKKKYAEILNIIKDKLD